MCPPIANPAKVMKTNKTVNPKMATPPIVLKTSKECLKRDCVKIKTTNITKVQKANQPLDMWFCRLAFPLKVQPNPTTNELAVSTT